MGGVMSLESKFAGRRKAYLAQSHPAMYAELEKSGTLNAHLDGIGRQASEMMEEIVKQKKPELEAIKDGQEREIREAQIWLMAEEIALQEIVLTL
ncbi:MAG: TnpV protein [Rhodomicrobium sp.]|nr:TnpV protein [Rhodomicrobium sp.]